MVFHTVLHQFLLVQVSGPTERTHKCWPVWNIAAYKRTHTHTHKLSQGWADVCICVTVKLNMCRCIQSHRQLRCWKMCRTNLNFYLEKVTNVIFTQIHWELQTHSHYRSVITASQTRKAQLWVIHVHFGNTSLCDQTALVAPAGRWGWWGHRQETSRCPCCPVSTTLDSQSTTSQRTRCCAMLQMYVLSWHQV